MFYKDLEDRPKTFLEVFQQYVEYKRDCLGRTSQTIKQDERMIHYLSDDLLNSPVAEITDEDIKKWIVQDFLSNRPKERSLKKQFQIINQVFEYAIRKKLCFDNPMKYVSAKDYLNRCDLEVRTDEEKEFSEDELKIIREESLKEGRKPRTLMRLLAMETGMRAGELAALHKSDIGDEFIHVHRQQRKDVDENGHEIFIEIPYTKDEAKHPHNGRFIPITPFAREIIDMALSIKGDSPYLFHAKGKMISKNTYAQNLRRFCKEHGILTTHNHAFRMAFNSRLIELGFSSADRALILGHEVQTNETHYSLTDKRRLAGIRDRMMQKGKPLQTSLATSPEGIEPPIEP